MKLRDFFLPATVIRLQIENRNLRSLVREMYVWTRYKETRWAKRARKATETTTNERQNT